MTGFGEDLLTIKTEPGPLRGEIQIKKYNSEGYISLLTNRPIFCCSKTNIGASLTFSAFIDNRHQVGEVTFHNYSTNLNLILENVLTGFSRKPNFRFFHLPANVRLLTYYCKDQKVTEALKFNGIRLENYAKISNTIATSPESLKKFRWIVQKELNLYKAIHFSAQKFSKPENTNIHETLTKCFSSSHELKLIPLKMIQRHELCKDLVAWGFNNPDQPQSLEGVIKALHTTRASLSQGCKESLGIGPMEVLKNIRLEHVHRALKDPKIRQQQNLKSVEEVRKHYGFQSRGNFAASYANYFGEKPYTTMKNS